MRRPLSPLQPAMDLLKCFWFFLVFLTTSATSSISSTSCPASSLPHPSTLNSTTSRRDFIRTLTRQAWSAYVATAWGQANLVQINGTLDPAARTFDSSGRTIFAALPTLWLQGHREEYERARSWIEKVFYSFPPKYTPQYLDSLVSSYALTGDYFYRTRAKTVSGYSVDPNSDAPDVLQQIPGWTYYLTFDQGIGVPETQPWIIWVNGTFFEKETEVNQTNVELVDETVRKLIAYAKLHHQARNDVPAALPAFLNLLTTSESYSHLGYLPNPGWTYLNRSNWRFMRYSDCGLGAAFALVGSSLRVQNESDPQATKLLKLARGIAEVCHELTLATSNRLPKMTFYIEANATNQDQPYYVLPVIEPRYQLEPELLETYLVLYRLTGEQKYRDWAWEIAISLYEHSRTGEGAIVGEADQSGTAYQDEKLFSGTLNYLYLIFSESWVLPLEKWVFNAAGHALPVYGKNAAWSQEWQ